MGWIMGQNKRLLQAGTLIILAVFAGCIWFIQYTRLEEPVFLRYCAEVSAVPKQLGLEHGTIITLRYITDADDKRTVWGISFPEMPDLQLEASEYQPGRYNTGFIYNTSAPQNGVVYGRYCLRSVYVSMNNYFQEDWEGETELHRAEIKLSDGSTFETDLGKIILYSDRLAEDAVNTYYSSSSNTDTASAGYKVLKDITIKSLESPVLMDAFAFLDLQVDDQQLGSIQPKEYKSGDTFLINNQFLDYQNYVNAYDEYDLRPKLIYEAADGTEGYTRIYNISSRRNFEDFWDVFDYLKGFRGVL